MKSLSEIVSINHPQALKDFINNYQPPPYATENKAAMVKAKKLIAQYEKKSKEYMDKAVNMRVTMRVMCPHVDKVIESKYYPGDYYSKAWTGYTVRCAECGDVLFTTDKSHSYYG